MTGKWVSLNPSKSQEVPPLDEGGCGAAQAEGCPGRGWRREDSQKDECRVWRESGRVTSAPPHPLPHVALRRKLRSLIVGRGEKQRLKWQFGGRQEYQGLWEIKDDVVDGFIHSFSTLLSSLLCTRLGAGHREIALTTGSPRPPGSPSLAWERKSTIQ